MGGSLARALRRLSSPPRIVAHDTDARTLARARDDGVIDAAAGAAEIFSVCDLVVLATPVRSAVELLRSHAGDLGTGATVTDLGSVKRPIVEAARALGLADSFVGGHPVAGDHRAGFEVARASLYDGACVWLTPLDGGGEKADEVGTLWRAVGARPALIDAEAHDNLMAWVSHLPQITASALGRVLGGAGIERSMLGPGGRDTTRLAASPTALWTEILLDNADLLERPMAELIDTLGALATALRERDARTIGALLSDAVHWTEKPE